MPGSDSFKCAVNHIAAIGESDRIVFAVLIRVIVLELFEHFIKLVQIRRCR
ncbi:hypothetical protein D3C78_865700 [compost metagenome]